MLVIVCCLFVSQDMSASIAKSCPQLYKAGIDNLYFKWKVINLVWLGFALYQSLIFSIVPVAAGMSAQNSSSIMLGVWDIGTLAYTCIIITVNLCLLMASGYITIWHQVSVGGSIVGWFLFLYFYSCVQSSWRQVQLFLAIQIRIQNGNFAFLMFVRFHL
jgi:phospholipid-transporting ATPase